MDFQLEQIGFRSAKRRAGYANRWAAVIKRNMKLKIPIVLVSIGFALVACSNPPSAPIPTQVMFLPPDLSLSVSTVTPIVTSTPIAFDASMHTITEEIDKQFNVENTSCDEIEYLNLEDLNVSLPIYFEQVNGQIDLTNEEIRQISDSIGGNNRVYVLSEYFCGTVNPDCRKNLIIWETKEDDQIFQIEWVRKKLFLHRSVTWLGENVIVVREVAFPGSFAIIGIDVETRKFVYYKAVSGCK